MLDQKWFPFRLIDQDNEEMYPFAAKRDYQRYSFVTFNVKSSEKGKFYFVPLRRSKREEACTEWERKYSTSTSSTWNYYFFPPYREDNAPSYLCIPIPPFANVSQLLSTTVFPFFYELILRSVNLGTKNILVVSPTKLPNVRLPH